MIYIMLFILLSAEGELREAKQSQLYGDWCLAEKDSINVDNYPHIRFNDIGLVTLFSRADTTYYCRYLAENDNLIIIRNENKDTVKCHILKLDADTLILSSLIERSGPQVYYRCK